MAPFTIVLLLLSLSAGVMSQAGIKCNCDSCNKCCQVPIPGECQKYCFCGSDPAHISFVVECEEGEVFNPETKMCEPEEYYSCPLPLNCTGKADGNYPYPGKCTEFITCSNGLASGRHCPDNLHFCFRPTCDPPRCEHQYLAKCESKPVEQSNCVEGEFYADEYNCSRYYRCAGNQLHQFSCPSKLHFCVECYACVHPEDRPTKCIPKKKVLKNGLPITDGTPVTVAANQKTKKQLQCTMPDGVYQLPENRTLQVVCEHGIANIVKNPQLLNKLPSKVRNSLNVIDHHLEACNRFYESHFNP